jgi:hypothetical protein
MVLQKTAQPRVDATRPLLQPVDLEFLEENSNSKATG